MRIARTKEIGQETSFNCRQWKKNSSNAIVNFEPTYKLSSRGTYRVKMSGTVSKGAKTDNISATSSSKRY